MPKFEIHVEEPSGFGEQVKQFDADGWEVHQGSADTPVLYLYRLESSEPTNSVTDESVQKFIAAFVDWLYIVEVPVGSEK